MISVSLVSNGRDFAPGGDPHVEVISSSPSPIVADTRSILRSSRVDLSVQRHDARPTH